MTDISAWIRERLTADHDIDRAELRELAVDLRSEERLWRPFEHHDADARVYQQLYRDPSIDVWLICWMHRQDTGYHDHDRSSGAVCVCEGTLWEDYFQRQEDGWIREQTRQHHAGGSFDFTATYIHGVRNEGFEPATSLHVYSPALWRMGHYEPDAGGIMQRISVTYADELLGAA